MFGHVSVQVFDVSPQRDVTPRSGFNLEAGIIQDVHVVAGSRFAH